MSIEKRRFIRFALDIPAFRYAEDGSVSNLMIKQISVGGCFVDSEESIFEGDEIRLEIPLPNKNRLPVICKAIYRFSGKGFGMKFHDVSQFEQELIASIITNSLESEGLPVLVDPFTQPPRYSGKRKSTPLTEKRLKEEEMAEEVIATEG